MMELTCFGKYGPYPKANCACSCYMITYGGKHILIDLGCGALTRVFTKLGAGDIDALVLSHLHADHMGDALTLRYALAAAKRLGRRSAPLPVYLPAAPAAEAGLIAAHEMIDANDINDGGKHDICGIDVRFALMPHPVPNYAMAFQADGRKLVYSGDTQYNGNLAGFARDADLFLMDAAFMAKDKTEASPHVSAKEAGRIAAEACAKRLLLTHIFPEYDEKDIRAEAREMYPAAELIQENMTYEV
ncbi:MAG: MBL fold metallo-hydrolase [Eubacteriales bacterium]|nr:MBL fold metallo-hydrolase [Eubacteriales bacterium]